MGAEPKDVTSLAPVPSPFLQRIYGKAECPESVPCRPKTKPSACKGAVTGYVEARY
jgi:hypothetical protein